MFMAIAQLAVGIAFTPLNLALADTNDTILKQAAQEIIKDTGAKEQFGKSENGDQLLDDAQAKANQKLNDLADKVNSDEDLADSQKLFLKNLQN